MGKNATVVILVLVIIAAVIIGVVMMGGGEGEEKIKVRQKQITVMDVESLEKVEVGFGDYDGWPNDKATGYKIAPDGRKLARFMQCPNCREEIPVTPIPVLAGTDEEDAARRGYMCPRCGLRVNQMGEPEFEL